MQTKIFALKICCKTKMIKIMLLIFFTINFADEKFKQNQNERRFWLMSIINTPIPLLQQKKTIWKYGFVITVIPLKY